MLRASNPELNLTRIHNFENIVRKHYVDSLIVIQLIHEAGLAWPSLMLDLGTGPGFPGIPLAIALPDHRFILADGRKQRTDFVERVVESLQLQNVIVHTGRISERSELRTKALITRAVESVERTLLRAASILEDGGLAIFMKGPAGEEEAANLGARFPFRQLLQRRYTLPNSEDRRVLLVYEKLPSREEDRLGSPLLIHSRDNARFKRYISLWSGRYVKQERLSLLCGERFIAEIVRHQSDRVVAFLLREHDTAALQQASAWQESCSNGPALEVFSRELFDELNQIGAPGMLALVKAPALPAVPQESPDGCTLFLPLGDPENLGAALRSAGALGASRIVLLQEAANPYHPRSLRSSAGLALQLTMYAGPPLRGLPDWCRNAKLPLYALDATGEDLRQVNAPKSFGLVVGNEGQGLPVGFQAEKLRIQMSPSVESLNAAAAVAVALYSLCASASARA
ncbi:MAG: 16S rRNA (guanine(527)-N(7))-methyltransferase RsmG [Leptospirales bacterium]|nr:16S rRNA (guanine(527)-N(7))-methyltransferase RsmG [Leptospirales bacterium]